MKIYFIDDSIDKVGGVERVINTLANRLADNYEICVVSKTKNNAIPFYKYKDSIKISYLWDTTKLLSKKIENKIIYIFIRLIEKIIFKIIIKIKIKNIAKNIINDDFVIFGRVHSALNYLPLFEKYNINPRIIVRDAINLDYFSYKMRRNLKKYFPKYVDNFIVSSDESMKEYINLFNDHSIKLSKIYNPLGIVPSNASYNYDNKSVISIGRMEDDQKGFSALIHAFYIVHQSVKDWNLTIYGEGKYRIQYQKLIDSLDANDYIKIVDATKNVVQEFNKCSIFVLPSRYEGYANILVEALSCGIPSISYNWKTGVEEIIKDNENGMVVHLTNRDKYYKGFDDVKDYENLAQSILYLINNKETCIRFSKNSKKIVESRSLDNIINKWIEIIEKK